MSVRQFDVRRVDRAEIKAFVEAWHYSGNINGVKSRLCFGLFMDDDLIGAAIFGDPATRGVAESYSRGGTMRVIELRRLCCIDNTPKNTESYFIGKMMRWISKNDFADLVLAYSDETHGHTGIIYRASNFVHVGIVAPIRVISWNGRTYHDRSLRVKYKGRLKPFSVRLRRALDDSEALWVDTKPKHVFTYEVR